MIQAKFSLEEAHIQFLNNYKKYGFKDKSAVIRAALGRLQKEMEREKLKMSADLYAEIFEEDEELQQMTESAIAGWPE
jgi:Arc/MetJ-type ribon-helix-helix transcriptional regulator